MGCQRVSHSVARWCEMTWYIAEDWLAKETRTIGYTIFNKKLFGKCFTNDNMHQRDATSQLRIGVVA